MIIDVIKKINYSINRLFSLEAQEYGLTGKQFFLLAILLKESRKRALTQKDIEKFGNLRKSTVSSILTNLEKNGFITRLNSQNDARSNIIKLTDKTLEIERKLNSKKKKIDFILLQDVEQQKLNICEEVLLHIQNKIKEIQG